MLLSGETFDLSDRNDGFCTELDISSNRTVHKLFKSRQSTRERDVIEISREEHERVMGILLVVLR